MTFPSPPKPRSLDRAAAPLQLRFHPHSPTRRSLPAVSQSQFSTVHLPDQNQIRRSCSSHHAATHSPIPNRAESPPPHPARIPSRSNPNPASSRAFGTARSNSLHPIPTSAFPRSAAPSRSPDQSASRHFLS